jgi:hypothetical protein
MLATPRRRGAALAVVLSAAIAGGLLVAGRDDEERRPAAGFEVALQDNAVFLHRYYYDLERAYGQARELGASWLRVTLLWSGTEPARGRFDWREADRAVDAAARHGIDVELNLTGPAPAWATGDGRVGVVRPDPRLFGEFVRGAAAHLRGRVRRYTVWNEPNYETWLAPQRTAASQYRTLYGTAHRAISDVDPDAQVLIGETAGPSQRGSVIPALRFLREVACRDRGGRPTARCEPLHADGYAHHPYDFTHPPEHRPGGRDDVTIGSLDRLETALDELAASGALLSREGRPLDVYLTEFGYLRRTERRLPDRVRAEYLRRAFDMARGRFPRVRQLLQYLLVSPPPDFPGGRFDTSVVSGSGEERAPFRALAEWSRANLP